MEYTCLSEKVAYAGQAIIQSDSDVLMLFIRLTNSKPSSLRLWVLVTDGPTKEERNVALQT